MHDVSFSEDEIMKLGALCIVDDDNERFVRYIEEDGEPVAVFVGGITQYYFSKERFAEDTLIYVHPDYRGRWHAVKLLKAFVKWAQERQVNSVMLKITSQIKTETAAKLYERLGFERVGYIYRWRTN